MTERPKNADFRRKPQIFADSPLLLEIPAFGGRRKPQKTADLRRKPKIFAENRRKPLIGLRRLRCVTFSSALMWIGVLWAGLRVAMWITRMGGKFHRGRLEKSLERSSGYLAVQRVASYNPTAPVWEDQTKHGKLLKRGASWSWRIPMTWKRLPLPSSCETCWLLRLPLVQEKLKGNN